MNAFKTFWICFCVWFVIAFQVEGYLNIDFKYDVPSIYKQTAELLCKVDSDKAVKEVIWYKLSDTKPTKTTVYYFEPPKYNGSGHLYENRAQIASDRSSLLLNSVTLDDEGFYECHVAVAKNSTTISKQIPEETEVRMKLSVNVPFSDVKLTTFSSGKNLTLICRAVGSKPPADISWVVTRGRESKELKPRKIASEFTGNLADTLGYLYWNIKPTDANLTFTCIVSHPETGAYEEKSRNLTAPSLINSVKTSFDWLGSDVPYTTYKSVTKYGGNPQVPRPSGLVEMQVSPATIVKQNSSVAVSITSDAFPEPSYTWWAEDFNHQTGRTISIEKLHQKLQLFCLIENSLGRVVMSVDLTPIITDDPDDKSALNPMYMNESTAVSGAAVAAIAFGSVAVIFVLAFMIYCCAFKQNSKTPSSAEGLEGGDFDSYAVKPSKSLSTPPTGQTKYRLHDDMGGVVTTTETDSLVKSGQDSFNATPRQGKKGYTDSANGSSSTTTSGYSDEVGGRNGTENQSDDEKSPDERNRAINKHLHDFDENASFVGEYGSTFGLDGASPPIVVESDVRESPFDHSASETSDDDEESIVSGASGIEGHYTLSHSRDEIDPTRLVQTPI